MRALCHKLFLMFPAPHNSSSVTIYYDTWLKTHLTHWTNWLSWFYRPFTNVHNFYIIKSVFCLFVFLSCCFILFVPRLTVFKKFHERKPLHWPNFNQSEYRWRTGGSKSFSCPCNNVRNLYYSHTHCSDFCFRLQEMVTCESNLNVRIFYFCIVLVVVKSNVHFAQFTVYFKPISRLLHFSLQSVLMFKMPGLSWMPHACLLYFLPFHCCIYCFECSSYF